MKKYAISPSTLVKSVFMAVAEAKVDGRKITFVSPRTGETITQDDSMVFDTKIDANLFIISEAEAEIQSMKRSIELRVQLIKKLKEEIL